MEMKRNADAIVAAFMCSIVYPEEPKRKRVNELPLDTFSKTQTTKNRLELSGVSSGGFRLLGVRVERVVQIVLHEQTFCFPD